MKKFIDVKVGDFIYYIIKNRSFVSQKDNYGNVHHDGINFFQFEVKSIKANAEMIGFNDVYNSYLSKTNFDLIITPNNFHESVGDAGERIYFTEERMRDKVMRDMAIQAIKDAEKKLADMKISTENTISQIRINYHSVLNPSHGITEGN